MSTDINARLVEFTAKTKYEDIPGETLEFTKYLTLKTMANILAGSVTTSSQRMAGLIREQRLPEEVGVIGGGFKTSLWEGVFLNSYFAHAAELEDDRFNDGISWDITVIPLLFALAEKLELSGRALLEALVIGLEVHTRTSTFSARHLGHYLIPGAVGPAAGAAKALGLGFREAGAAIGLALSGVPLSVVNLGTDGHFFESALHSLQGIMAAQMAKAGLSGNPDIVKYLSDYLGKERIVPKKMVEGLGEKWVLREIQIKKYPCCIILHRQIDALIELMKQHNLSYKDIRDVEVHGSPGDTDCNRPDPKTEGDLQFSFQHVLAVALLDGDIGLERMTREAVTAPTLKEARGKIKFILHGELPSEQMKAPGHVVVITKDGKEFSRKRQHAIGNPREPLTKEQFEDLYFKFTGGIKPEEVLSRVQELTLNLEKLSNIKELMNLLL